MQSPDAHRYHLCAVGAGESAGKPRLHRCRPAAADPEALGCADRAATGSGGRPDGEVQHVQPLDQHQRADARPPARRGGSVAADAASGLEGLGVRAPAVAVSCLWPLWRRLPLRHIGYQASGRARGLFLTGSAMDKAGWHEFLVYALNRPLAFAIIHLAARLGPAAHLPPIGTFVNDAEIAREVLTDTAHFDSHSPVASGFSFRRHSAPMHSSIWTDLSTGS